MKRLAPALLLASAIAFGSCATKTPPPVDYVVDGVVECAKAGVHEVAINLIDDAASALATGDWESALLKLVKRWGEGAVDCAVAEVGDTSGKHAALNELEATKARRAKEWLASRPVKVSSLQKKKGAPSTTATQGARTGDGGSSAPTFHAGICAGCGHAAKVLGEPLTSQFSFRWALPFEDMTPLVTLSASAVPGPCRAGMHDLLFPPYLPGKVCVTDDYTFDVEARYPTPTPTRWFTTLIET